MSKPILFRTWVQNKKVVHRNYFAGSEDPETVKVKNEILKNFKFGGNGELIEKQINFLRNNLNLDEIEFENLLNSLDISKNFLSHIVSVLKAKANFVLINLKPKL